MNIGTVAKKSGVPSKTIRYYEGIGLIPSADRRPNGYRSYDEVDIHVLHFIKRARSLGFSVDEVRDLLELWRDRRRSSAAVKALATKHLDALDRKILGLRSMSRTLRILVERCQGDDRPNCPILDDLADGERRSPRRREIRSDS